MSTALAKPKPAGEATPWTEREESFVPFGETEPIRLSVGMVSRFLAVPTRSGKMPSEADCLKFVMLCRARQLNPWVKDCWLVGYDSKEGPNFEQICAHQALLKRAEACPAYRGMESGVIVGRGDELVEVEGAFAIDGDVLLGGWSRVWRADRDVPQVGRVKLATYNTNQSRWAKDPHGMIAKVAEAAALRKAFPTQLGGMYCAEELREAGSMRAVVAQSNAGKIRKSDLNAKLGVTQPRITEAVAETPDAAPEDDPQQPPTTEELIASGELEPDDGAPVRQASMLPDDDGDDAYYGAGG